MIEERRGLSHEASIFALTPFGEAVVDRINARFATVAYNTPYGIRCVPCHQKEHTDVKGNSCVPLPSGAVLPEQSCGDCGTPLSERGLSGLERNP